MKLLPTEFSRRIKELSRTEKWQELFHLYNQHRRTGIEVSDPTVFSSIVKASSRLSIPHAESIHSCSVKLGLASSSSIANSTLDFYTKCQNLHSAVSLFTSMEARDSISWNIIVNGFLNHGDSGEGLRWFNRARAAKFEPNISTIVMVIQSCQVSGAEEIHSYITKIGLWDVLSVQNSFLSYYAHTDIGTAQKLFDEMPERDVISWSVVIQGYVNSGGACDALDMFGKMSAEANVEPDGISIVSVLKAIRDLMTGRSIHGFVIRKILDFDIFVENSLIDMYSKNSDPESAIRVFQNLRHRNHVTWNVMISGFVHNEKFAEALLLFSSMIEERVEFDAVTLGNILQICKFYTNPSKSVHAVAIRKGYSTNEFLINSLIDSYGRCNSVKLSRRLFQMSKTKDTVSWSTMIAAFTHTGKPYEAVGVFNEMISAQEKPNLVTIINLLEACSVSAQLEPSMVAHGITFRRGLAEEVAVGTAIVDMYSKCGAIVPSRKVFDQIPEKNIIAWSAMILGYAMNGRALEAIALFSEMRLEGLTPNHVTALSVLSACNHGGLVEEGLSFFESLVHGSNGSIGPEHYSCVVDMLGRAGKLDEAMELIDHMPQEIEAGPAAWGAILSSSRNGNFTESAIDRVLELQPHESANYMLASSIYASAGSWGKSAEIRKSGRERGVQVIAGHSLVYLNNKPCSFLAGEGTNHPMIGQIKIAVEQLHRCMRISRDGDFIAVKY